MKSTTDLSIDLRAVIYTEHNVWIAHCLEMDVVAEGASADQALGDLLDLCAYQIEYSLAQGDLRSIFRPAPEETWVMYWRAHKKRLPKKPSKPVGRFEARKYAIV
jgi:hypothetical protein